MPQYELVHAPKTIDGRPVYIPDEVDYLLADARSLYMELWGPFRSCQQPPSPNVLADFLTKIIELCDWNTLGYGNGRSRPSQASCHAWIKNIAALAEAETQRRFQKYPDHPPPWFNFNAGTHFKPDDDFYRGLIICSSGELNIDDANELRVITERLAERYPLLSTSSGGRALQWRNALKELSTAPASV